MNADHSFYTSYSLLDQLCNESDAASWDRLISFYSPLLRSWIDRYDVQAATGLQYAHEKGMVHRDIKPHNLMLAADGQVRILDFGLAGFAEAAFGTGDSFNRHANGVRDSRDGRQSNSPTPMALGLNKAQPSAAHLTTMGRSMFPPNWPKSFVA